MATQSATAPSRTAAKGEYTAILTTLSEGSVNRHFDPYTEIDWESAEWAVIPNDPRWILPAATDPLGAHPWYLALPESRKIEIGMWRQANIAKVGLQFEELLIGGVMNYLFAKVPNGSAEFRYLNHEVAEEVNHTLMFQEMVNRIGADVPGMGSIMKLLGPLVPLLGRFFPTTFFVAVLAGEEPIDHVQKQVLRAGEDVHPIMRDVMRIHIAEEARHIAFAHEYLRHRVPKQHPVQRATLSLAYPIIMFIACDLIVKPPRSLFREFDIPKGIRRELFWRSAEARARRRDFFGEARMLAAEIGLMNPAAKLAWRALRIDGKESRYRGEPVRTHS
ncbi:MULTISPECIES: AurF N-oxygenase family protein [Nocardia]|uniref:AurF N-oxygenase family protein n=1 Tax=Nocardia TaxID=1817 RepID=UPI00068A06C6|nr:diiron oxygenase [Nocardia vulneris]